MTLCSLHHYLQQPSQGNNLGVREGWLEKEEVVRTYNGILAFATTWRALESIMLSKIIDMEKDKHRVISLICGI